MTLIRPLAIALLLMSSTVARAEEPAAVDDGPAMATAVRMKVPAVEFKQVPFVDVLDFMRDVAKLNIHVNWPALEAIGVDRNVPVTINLRQIALSRVLDLTLGQVSAGRGGVAWYVSDNIIYVTTRELADRDLITRVYPVQDLLVDVPNFEGPSFQLGGSSSAGGSGEGGGGSVFNGNNNDASNEENSTMQERGEKLVELIMMLVSPEVWQENGGYSRIRYFNGTLIVTAPRSVQMQIGK